MIRNFPPTELRISILENVVISARYIDQLEHDAHRGVTSAICFFSFDLLLKSRENQLNQTSSKSGWKKTDSFDHISPRLRVFLL